MNPISPANIQPRPMPANPLNMPSPRDQVESMISAPVVLPPRYAPRRRIPNVRFAPLFTLDEPQVTSASLAEPQSSRRTLWMHEGPRELQIIEMGPNGTPLPPQPPTQRSPSTNDNETGEPVPKKRRSYIKDKDFLSKIRGLPEDLTSNEYSRAIAPRTEDLVHQNGTKAVAVSVHNSKTQTEVVVKPLIDIETIPTSPSATTRWLAETIIAASAFQRPPRPQVISRAAAEERNRAAAAAEEEQQVTVVETRPGYENIDPALQGPMPEVLTSGRISRPSKRKLEMMGVKTSPSKFQEAQEISRRSSTMSGPEGSDAATNIITETDLKRAKNMILDHLTVADPSTKLYSRRKNKGSIAYALHYRLIGKEAFITALWDFSEDAQLIDSLKMRSQSNSKKIGDYETPNNATQQAIEALFEPETPQPQVLPPLPPLPSLPPVPPPAPQYMHQVAPQYIQPSGPQFSHQSPPQWYRESPPRPQYMHESPNHFMHQSPPRYLHQSPPRQFQQSPPRYIQPSPSITPAPILPPLARVFSPPPVLPPLTRTYTPTRQTIEIPTGPSEEEIAALNKKIGAIQTITSRLTATVHAPEKPADAFDETREETFEDQDGEDFTFADIDAFLMIANGGHPFQHEDRLNPLSEPLPGSDTLPAPNVKARPTWPALQHAHADHEVINLIRDAIYEKARRTWRPDDFNDAISRILQHIPQSSRRMCDEMERLLVEAEISANHAMQPAMLEALDKLYKSLAEALENNAAVLGPLAEKLKELAG